MKMKTGHFTATAVDEDDNEITLEVSYSGYYLPARISGRLEDCYPADSDIEVTLLPNIPLPQKEYARLAELAFEHMLENPQ